MDGKIKKTLRRLYSREDIKKTLELIEKTAGYTLDEQIELTSIPAPTFSESERGTVFASKLEKYGVEEVTTDNAGNVFGIRRGSDPDAPKLVISAHLDTVFPEGTAIDPEWKDGKVYAPGIADDGRGLACVLTFARAVNSTGLTFRGDLIIGATVGEEGLGDLYGVKNLFNTRSDIDAFISVEPGSPERIIFQGTGSRRYRISFHSPGGHSFGDFGVPSANHALGRAVAKIADLNVPGEPKTTFTVGEVSGGTSVNTISAEAVMVIDLRSTDQMELVKLENKVLKLVDDAAAEENDRWNRKDITVKKEKVGDRPAGSQSQDSPIVQAAAAAVSTLGLTPALSGPISTDSNVPISLGVPALTLGGGGDFGGAHTLQEYFDPTDAHLGPQHLLLTAAALAGVSEGEETVLNKTASN
ncbi:M20/M25/M40 family metallo-hydrolase [Alteribacter natronophilus]|uniref:M20/M25/M40 family metallo-hydrolase n=1 Tax=Alteribacter natronophilus TaxID=2583810 RepID=UPI001FEC2087|nr:M20/M25/M40 family metallo-hydrolase [Alteribacter natronophilus]